MQRDPFHVDRKLAEAARAWLAWRRALRHGTGSDHRFERLGAFASRELVLELEAAGARDPLAPALAAWARRLHFEHETAELVARREHAYRGERHAMNAPEPGEFSLRELLDAALADAKGARRAALDALVRHAPHAAELELRRWELRLELATALGDAKGETNPLGALDAPKLAEAFLDATAAPFAELGARDLSSLLALGLGRESFASWPGRLTARSLASLFDEAKWLEHVALDLDELPRPFGASSFLRGLAAFGAALGASLTPVKLPFVLAREPFDLRGERLGALFALVPFGESFARRKLDVPRQRYAEHRRVLSRIALVAARALALRVLLRAPALAGSRALKEAYPELVFRALAVEVAPSAAGVLFRARVSDPARFVGLLAGAEERARLERVHDEDWYRNPRAVTEVRETVRQSAAEPPSAETLERGARELAALAENAL
ncbi:MAG TPA: hypothetical protein VFZ53_18595 [Polyangiaceae bacterium]